MTNQAIGKAEPVTTVGHPISEYTRDEWLIVEKNNAGRVFGFLSVKYILDKKTLKRILIKNLYHCCN